MHFRDFADGDHADGIHGPAEAGSSWRRTLVAEDHGDVLGMATLLLSPVHRDCYYAEVEVEPEVRRQGIGRALFEALAGVAPHPYPVLTRAMSSRPVREAFASAVGFRVVMRCPAPQVNPTSTAVDRWIEEHQASPGITVVPAQERSFEEVLDAWVDLFVWIHETWLPTYPRPTVLDVFAETCLDEVDFGLSRVALLDDQIVALACVLPDQSDRRCFLVAETVERSCPDGTEILAATIGAALQACAAEGTTFVEFDGHEVDPHYYPLSQTLPVLGADPFLVMRHPGFQARV